MLGKIIMEKIKTVLFITVAVPVLIFIVLFFVPSNYDTDI
jgi:hypothetical protein